MPLRPSDLVAKSGKRIVLAMDETGKFALSDDPAAVDTVTIRYRVAALTTEAGEHIVERFKAGDSTWLIDMFLARVVSWDLADPDDPTKTFPLDAKRIRAEISADFLDDAIAAMNKDAGLGKAWERLIESTSTSSDGFDLSMANGAASGASPHGSTSTPPSA